VLFFSECNSFKEHFFVCSDAFAVNASAAPGSLDMDQTPVSESAAA